MAGDGRELAQAGKIFSISTRERPSDMHELSQLVSWLDWGKFFHLMTRLKLKI